MKNLFAIMVLALASLAMAQPWPNLVLDVTDPMNVTLSNVGAGPLAFDGIQILSETGKLVDITATYLNIDLLVGGFAQLASTPYEYTEVNLVGYGYAAPGKVYTLGHLVTTSNPADYQLFYTDTENRGGRGTLVSCNLIPEPASMSLLAVGVMSLLRRRR